MGGRGGAGRGVGIAGAGPGRFALRASPDCKSRLAEADGESLLVGAEALEEGKRQEEQTADLEATWNESFSRSLQRKLGRD